MQLLQLASRIIQTEEAWRPRAYYCSEGYPTIGWGFRVGGHKGALPDTVMTREEGAVKLSQLVNGLHEQFTHDARTAPLYALMIDIRKSTLISMAFQIGFEGVLRFSKMWWAIKLGDWHTAGVEALDSVVAREQTPSRWKRNAYMLQTGVLHTYYGFIE